MIIAQLLYNSDSNLKKEASLDEIPHYFLYGETQATGELEFIHYESIFSRIEEQNWEVKPHRHDHLHQLFLLEHGNMIASLETHELNLVGPRITFIPAGQVHGFKYNEAAKGQIITISDAFMRNISQGVGSRFVTGLLTEITTFRLDPKGQSDQDVIEYVKKIGLEYQYPAAGRVEAIGALLHLIIVHLGRSLAIQRVNIGDSAEHAKIFERFRELVASHYKEHWRLSSYCKALGVGERRLNRICRSIADINPSLYIQHFLLQEAKRNLIYTRKPITQICYELGFNDPAYFSRFFSKQVGLSPKAYVRRFRDVADSPLQELDSYVKRENKQTRRSL